jgi:energy-coupling factor transport system ATP-binding protein
VISITHDLNFCATYFDRIIVLRQGEIIIDGPSERVLLEQELLASAAVAPPQLVRLARALNWNHFSRTPEAFVNQYYSREGS